MTQPTDAHAWWMKPCSQVPSIFVYYNTWKKKSGENVEGLFLFIELMMSSGCEVDMT